MALNTFTNKANEFESDDSVNENTIELTSVHDKAFENDEDIKTDNKIAIDAVAYKQTSYNLEDEASEDHGPHNDKPLFKHSNTFELEKFEKNILLIFNHKNVEGKEPRLGTEKDVKALTDTFQKLGFEIVPHNDLTREEVFSVLKTFATQNFTNYGCIAIAFLTHGKKGMIRAKDGAYSEMEIWNYLKAYDKPTLITKPRILIIQACRGQGCMQGIPVRLPGHIELDEDIGEERDESDGQIFKGPFSMFQDEMRVKGVHVRPTNDKCDDEEEFYHLPEESDIIILHSSSKGKRSLRDAIEGSWFIQSLCTKINELSATHDLESILTEVKREVAIERDLELWNRETIALETIKQMPVVTSTLTRKLYLRNFRLPVVFTPLRLQYGQCSCNFNHFEHIENCVSLAEWMTHTETYLESKDFSSKDIKELLANLSERRGMLNNINCIGPRLCQVSRGEGAAYFKCITTVDNRRFDAIVEKVHVLRNKVLRVYEVSKEISN